MHSESQSTGAPSPGTGIAGFEAGAPPLERGLRLTSRDGLNPYQSDGHWLLRMSPSGDYYAEDNWAFSFTERAARRAPSLIIELDFLDEGFGVIAARRLADASFNGHYVEPSQAVSYTRLNTGRFRRAAFAFDEGPAGTDPEGKADLLFTGVQHLRSIRVFEHVPDSYWDQLRGEIPEDVAPLVSLQHPMQVVCSADGALSGMREDLRRSRHALRESLPLVKGLGFNAVESYVRWNLVEPEPGRFDWSIYDAIVEDLQRHGLKWFPLLVVGSAYTLPEWFHDSGQNVGFTCLEHGLSNPIQSIWSPHHKQHVTRFLHAFGRHYEPLKCLQGVRLGPTGNFGESQYPAGGNWGYHGEPMHIHIGMWAGDAYARAHFRQVLRQRYGSIEELNRAWHSQFARFLDIEPLLPDQCVSKRQRFDLNAWYTDSMTEWCAWWAHQAREAMPNTPIFQSSGGWGATEIGTDYSAQTRTMREIGGRQNDGSPSRNDFAGIRLTNELDSFHQCFYATRLAATAARLYLSLIHI